MTLIRLRLRIRDAALLVRPTGSRATGKVGLCDFLAEKLNYLPPGARKPRNGLYLQEMI